MWAALYGTFREPRQFLTSGGLGTMGYGFPAAIGAQLGNPGRRVIDIAGDGSIQMNIQELATAVQEGLPVIVAILNNGYLGMVRQWQELFFDRRYSPVCLMRNGRCPRGCSTPGDQCPTYLPDFVKLAEDQWELVFKSGVDGGTAVQIEYQRQRKDTGGNEELVPVVLAQVRQTSYFWAIRAAVSSSSKTVGAEASWRYGPGLRPLGPPEHALAAKSKSMATQSSGREKGGGRIES